MISHREPDVKRARELLNCCLNDKDLNSLSQFMGKEVLVESPIKFSVGLDSFKGIADVWLRAFPDLEYKEKNLSVHENFVQADLELKGTHLGDFLSLSATGKSVSFKSTARISFTNGQLLHYVANTDVKKITEQIICYGLEHAADQTSEDIHHVVNTLLGTKLSRRQIECVSLSMLYLSTKQIANTLGIDHDTAQTHLNRAFGILGVTNRGMLFDYAISQHVVELLTRLGLFLKNKHG